MPKNAPRRSSLPLLAALICAVITMMLLTMWMRQLARKETAKADLASIVVTTQHVMPRAELTTAALRVESYPRELLPTGTFQSIDQVAGRFTRVGLAPGQVLTAALVSPLKELEGLSREIAANRRAVAVPVDIASGVAFQIREGDRVDIVVTVERDVDESISKVVLQNVLILKLMGIDPKGSEQKSRNATAIVDVSVEEAEKLALVQAKGSITLALRGSTDSGTVRTRGATVQQTLADSAINPAMQMLGTMLARLGERKSVPLPAPAAPPPQSVELLLGTERQQVVVNKGQDPSR